MLRQGVLILTHWMQSLTINIARDPEIHIHRIGRTGRAGSKGIACSLFAEKERYKVSQLEKYN